MCVCVCVCSLSHSLTLSLSLSLSLSLLCVCLCVCVFSPARAGGRCVYTTYMRVGAHAHHSHTLTNTHTHTHTPPPPHTRLPQFGALRGISRPLKAAGTTRLGDLYRCIYEENKIYYIEAPMKKILLYCKHDKSFSFLNKIYCIDALMKKNAQTSSTWMHALKADTNTPLSD